MAATGPSPASEDVEIAVRLGWRLAQAYHEPPPNQPSTAPTDAPPPPELPSQSQLSAYQVGQIAVAEIAHDVRHFTVSLALSTPSDADVDNLVDPHGSPATTRASLLSLYLSLRLGLAADGGPLVTALDLGRMLAYTVLLSDPSQPKTVSTQFGHDRLANAYGWLDDLHHVLPEHAADAVKGSLRQWENWASRGPGVVSRDAAEEFTRDLRRQGELWRRLLCGEKSALDLLAPADYKRAGDRVARHFLGLIGSYVLSWWYVIVFFAAVTAGVAFAVVRYAPNGPSTVAALIATAAGTLGVSWKTVAATLGKVTARAEGPLWDTEVRQAIIVAATRLPRPVPRTG